MCWARAEQADVKVSEHDLRGGEMILLCSDGLHGVLDDRTLLMILSAGGTPVDIVPQLIETALARGARDNVTAVLAALQRSSSVVDEERPRRAAALRPESAGTASWAVSAKVRWASSTAATTT